IDEDMRSANGVVEQPAMDRRYALAEARMKAHIAKLGWRVDADEAEGVRRFSSTKPRKRVRSSGSTRRSDPRQWGFGILARRRIKGVAAPVVQEAGGTGAECVARWPSRFNLESAPGHCQSHTTCRPQADSRPCSCSGAL